MSAPFQGVGSMTRQVVFIACFIAALCLHATVCGAARDVQSVPNVRLTDRFAYVGNPDNVLAQSDVAAINRMAADLERRLGVQLAVVAVKDLGGGDARTFATDLFNLWGVGRKGQDDGLLILLVADPAGRSIVFETGYGLEGVLPDVVSFRIQQRHMLPDLKNGDYGAGLIKGVAAINEQLSAKAEELAGPGKAAPSEENVVFTAGVFVFCLFLFFVLARRDPELLLLILKRLLSGRGGRGGPPNGRSGGSGFGGGGSWGGGRSGGGGSISRF